MKRNQVIKLVCFALCIILVLTFLGRIFRYHRPHMKVRLNTYEQLEEDTVDVAYVGTSGVHCFWLTGQAFKDYGQTVYPCTINGIQPWHMLTMVKYAQKYQNPKLFVIDTRPFTLDDDPANMEARSRYFNEILPQFSLLRLQSTNRSLKYVSSLKEETGRFDLDFFFSVFRYHDMWEDGISYDVLHDTMTPYYGYLVSKNMGVIKQIEESVFSDQERPLEDFCQECLDELIDYAEKNDLELLFASSPRYTSQDVAEKTNRLYHYLEEKGIPVFDCTTREGEQKYPMEKNGDFYNASHVNYYGAAKYTSYFSKYLDENYDLPDRRNDPKCSEWLPAYEKTLKKIKDRGAEIED